MTGDMDPFDFVLAERLGVPLSAVGAMPNPEYEDWRAFYAWRAAQEQIR